MRRQVLLASFVPSDWDIISEPESVSVEPDGIRIKPPSVPEHVSHIGMKRGFVASRNNVGGVISPIVEPLVWAFSAKVDHLGDIAPSFILRQHNPDYDIKLYTEIGAPGPQLMRLAVGPGTPIEVGTIDPDVFIDYSFTILPNGISVQVGAHFAQVQVSTDVARAMHWHCAIATNGATLGYVEIAHMDIDGSR